MIRHIALFRWNDGVTPADIAEFGSALDALVPQLPSIRAYAHGPDAGLGTGTWDYAVVADFDDADGWLAYDEHPAHAAVRTERIAPLAAERASVRIVL